LDAQKYFPRLAYFATRASSGLSDFGIATIKWKLLESLSLLPNLSRRGIADSIVGVNLASLVLKVIKDRLTTYIDLDYRKAHAFDRIPINLAGAPSLKVFEFGDQF
jgi:hypothetical protein